MKLLGVGLLFCDSVWALGRRVWQRRNATRAPIQVPECRVATAALSGLPFWPESVKFQGCGDRVPVQKIILVGIAELLGLLASHSGDNILRNPNFPKENHPHD